MAKMPVPTVGGVQKLQSLKDEMPLKGPALTRPQPPPRTKSRSMSRSMTKGRRY